MKEKNSIHTKYLLKDGREVYGATTILGMLDKPALIAWAWNQGKAGLDFRKTRDTAASIGTIAHYLIECHLKNEKPRTDDYSKNDIDKAETAYLAYLDFEKNNKLSPLKMELPLVSEKYHYGGTIDLYCELSDKKTLIDFKTSSGIYPEMRCQVRSYYNLLIENNYPCEEVHILRIDKVSGEFHHQKLELDNLEDEWELFKLLTQAYPLKKKIWKG